MGAAPKWAPEVEVEPWIRAGLPALAMSASHGGSAGVARRRGPLQALGNAPEDHLRVLLVDPDGSARSVLHSRLAAAGFEVIPAMTSQEAMRALKPGRPEPSLIVIESELSGTDGFALCAQIRAESRTAHIPVVVLSGRPDETHLELAGLAAADAYLPKPVYANDIVALAKLFGGHDASERIFELDTREVSLAQLLRALLSATRPGRIQVEQGQLAFREGRVVDASYGALRGSEALSRLLFLARGSYQVSFGMSLGRATCAYGLEELCDRFFPKLRRWEQLLERSVPLDAVLAVQFKRLAEELPGLPEKVNGVVRLFDGCRTVRDCVMESKLNEVTTLEVVDRLYAMGVLAPASGEPDAIFLGRPKLFEPEPKAAEERMLELFGEGAPEATETEAPRSYDWFDDVERWVPEELSATSADAGWVERQIEAFRIQTVVEPPERTEVEAFARGEAPPREDAVASVYEAVEERFFSNRSESREERWGRPALGALLITALSLLLGVTGIVVARRASTPKPSAPVAMVAPLAHVTVPARPAEAGPTLEQGLALYEAGNTSDAAAVLAQVTAAHPDSAKAWTLLGLARFDSGDNVGAEDAARRAAQLDPKAGRPHMLLATIAIAREDRAAAEQELKAYLALEPKGDYAEEAQKLLERW